jgi:PAS domain S-box-containing protein
VRHRFLAKLESSTALRYALAPAFTAIAVLIHLSVVGPYLHPTALFLAGIVAAAWFGGAGPGLLAALLAALALPQLIPMNYPLVAGFFDLPRFLAFALTGVAVGWGATRRKRAEEALRQSEQELRAARDELEMRVMKRTADLKFSEERYVRAMGASNDGLWEWNPMTDELFVSPRAKHLFGVPDEIEIRTRADLKAHGGFHPEDRRRIGDAFKACLAPGYGGFDVEYRVIHPGGIVTWVRSRGKVFAGSLGQPTLLTGSLTDITEQKLANEALRTSEAALRLSEKRYALAPGGVRRRPLGLEHRRRRVLRRPADARAVRISSGNDFSGRSDFLAASVASGRSPEVGGRGRGALRGYDDPHRHGDPHSSP